MRQRGRKVRAQVVCFGSARPRPPPPANGKPARGWGCARVCECACVPGPSRPAPPSGVSARPPGRGPCVLQLQETIWAVAGGGGLSWGGGTWRGWVQGGRNFAQAYDSPKEHAV